MKKMKGLLLLCLISMLYTPVVAVAANLVPSVKVMKGELASNRIIVKLKQGVMASAASQVFSSVGVQNEHKFNAVNMSVLNLVKGKQSKAVIRALIESGIVEFAEPDRMLYINAVPNDPAYPLLWGLNNTGQTFGTANADIDADLAWDITTGDPNVVVGVIDTGVDYNHPDLAANIWVNPGEIAGNFIDDDGNGYIDDVHGINAIVGSGDPMDDNSHGTHVSGTIGAVG
ncbi:MAG: S8 family serine peptidase, partial [Ghiorsea sp.]|nr:S8 family serine peptidase [Ghiorsea sp.]